jgi:hypothetical protein
LQVVFQWLLIPHEIICKPQPDLWAYPHRDCVISAWECLVESHMLTLHIVTSCWSKLLKKQNLLKKQTPLPFSFCVLIESACRNKSLPPSSLHVHTCLALKICKSTASFRSCSEGSQTFSLYHIVVFYLYFVFLNNFIPF